MQTAVNRFRALEYNRFNQRIELLEKRIVKLEEENKNFSEYISHSIADKQKPAKFTIGQEVNFISNGVIMNGTIKAVGPIDLDTNERWYGIDPHRDWVTSIGLYERTEDQIMLIKKVNEQEKANKSKDLMPTGTTTPAGYNSTLT
jgi:hypothetical protein